MALDINQLFASAGTVEGNRAVYDALASGQVSEQAVRNQFGNEAVDWYLNKHNLTLPGTQNPQNGTLFNTGAAAPTNTASPTSTTQNTTAQQAQQPNLQSNFNYDRYPTPIPKQPNYWDAATAQGGANLDSARATVGLSNPDVYTPFGKQTVTTGDNGQPVVTQQLSADQQQILDQRNQILPKVFENIMMQTGQRIGQYDFPDAGNPDLKAGLSERTIGTGQDAQSAVVEALRQREQPRIDRQKSSIESQLIAQGFNPGTEAWNAKMDDFNRGVNDFNLGLTTLGGQEQSRLFGMESDLRRQQLGENQSVFDASNTAHNMSINDQVLARTLPIQEYQALVSAMTPNMPSFPSYTGASVEAAPYFNAINAQGLFDLNRYGTSISGELGTRGIDTGIKQGYLNAATNLAGAFI